MILPLRQPIRIRYTISLTYVYNSCTNVWRGRRGRRQVGVPTAARRAHHRLHGGGHLGEVGGRDEALHEQRLAALYAQHLHGGCADQRVHARRAADRRRVERIDDGGRRRRHLVRLVQQDAVNRHRVGHLVVGHPAGRMGGRWTGGTSQGTGGTSHRRHMRRHRGRGGGGWGRHRGQEGRRRGRGRGTHRGRGGGGGGGTSQTSPQVDLASRSSE